MLDQDDLLLDDLWLMDEDMAIDEPSDVLGATSGAHHWLDSDRQEEELGLRSILERPEVLSKVWRHTANTTQHRAKRLVDVVRAP